MKVLITTLLPEEITDRISDRHEVACHFLDPPMPPEHLRKAAVDCHGILCTISDTIDTGLLEAAPLVKVIANIGAGYNNIDVAAATARNILVTNTPGVLIDATADLAMALILAVGRRLVEGDRRVRESHYTLGFSCSSAARNSSPFSWAAKAASMSGVRKAEALPQ